MAQHSWISLDVYIDDLAAWLEGRREVVRERVLKGAFALAKALRDLGLELSTAKGAVLCSDSGLLEDLRVSLAELAGLEFVGSARNLGIDYSVGACFERVALGEFGRRA